MHLYLSIHNEALIMHHNIFACVCCYIWLIHTMAFDSITSINIAEYSRLLETGWSWT